MTRRQMIEAIVDDQIKRGVIPAEGREHQIRARLNGIGAAKRMSYEECKVAYEGYFTECTSAS